MGVRVPGTPFVPFKVPLKQVSTLKFHSYPFGFQRFSNMIPKVVVEVPFRLR